MQFSVVGRRVEGEGRPHPSPVWAGQALPKSEITRAIGQCERIRTTLLSTVNWPLTTIRLVSVRQESCRVLSKLRIAVRNHTMEDIMSRFGPHIDPPLAAVPSVLEAGGWRVFQTTLRDPKRLSKDGIPDPEDQAAFRQGISGIAGVWGMVHASMLTSLGSPEPRIRHGSANALIGDANLAAVLGMQGVCFHVGYQKGHDSREAALDSVAFNLERVLEKLNPGARVLLENGCEGTELGQTIEEVGRAARASGGDPARLGVVLDTCHLHVAGFDLSAPEAPDLLADEIEAAGLTSFIAALHLNDAREPCGSHRDRHAPPGLGTIGDGLRRLIAHPMFASLPCILEIASSEVAAAAAFLDYESSSS